MDRLLKEYRNFRPFKDEEAWFLFKLAAFAEAAGWTLLISGILFQRYVTPKSNIPVLITGQIHGTFFLIYMAAAALLSPSLNWTGRQAVIATACGVPPYGSLIFELIAAHRRYRRQLKITASISAYMALSKKLSA